MALAETLNIERIGIDMDLLADPIVQSTIDYSREFLWQTQDRARVNLAKINKDPSLSILVFRSNICPHSIDLSNGLREIGINSRALINKNATRQENNTSLFTLIDKKEHILLSIDDINGNEVIFDPFYSQFLDQFGISFDLAAKLGDSRIFPEEIMLIFRPDQMDQLVEWITSIVTTFWGRVAIGDLRPDTDIFTKARQVTSIFEVAAGIEYDPIKPVTLNSIEKTVRQIWDRANYRMLTQEEINKF